MVKNHDIEAAVEKVGGLTATARATGAPSYQAVQQWIAVGRVPAKYCVTLENISGISRRMFRPDDADLIWPELKEVEHA